MTQPGIELELIVLVADALFPRPLIELNLREIVRFADTRAWMTLHHLPHFKLL